VSGGVKEHDLDLGDGHWLDWLDDGGGLLTHTSTKTESGYCGGAFQAGRWFMTGTKESPTFSPSFVCHCGDHGFIQNGKWVRA
jgi:hypothetical protein